MRALARRSLLSLSSSAMAAALLASPLVGIARPARADPVVLDRIVAVVNDDIILQSDLDLWMMYDDRVLAELAQLSNQNATEDQLERKLFELRPMALDELVARKLMLTQAPTFQISASEAETIWMSRIAMNMPKTIARKAISRRGSMRSSAGAAAAPS